MCNKQISTSAGAGHFLSQCEQLSNKKRNKHSTLEVTIQTESHRQGAQQYSSDLNLDLKVLHIKRVWGV